MENCLLESPPHAVDSNFVYVNHCFLKGMMYMFENKFSLALFQVMFQNHGTTIFCCNKNITFFVAYFHKCVPLCNIFTVCDKVGIHHTTSLKCSSKGKDVFN
jgi:hypothetical protein